MVNNSAIGGYLLATDEALPGGLTLVQYVQQVFVGVTGIAGAYVRPAWQPNPPKQPDVDVNWMAFEILNNKGDSNAYFEQEPDNAILQKQEELRIRCIFYGPEANSNANKLKDGLQLSQNREKLFLAGMGYGYADDITSAPELINDIWFNRADVDIYLRREIKRSYQILSLLAAEGIIITDNDPQIIIPFSTENVTA